MKQLLKSKQLNFVVKVIIVALLLYAIYKQVFAKENAAEIAASFMAHFEGWNILWLVFVALLIPVNWGFEALKWRELIRSFSDYSLGHIYKAILAGVAVSLFTPNRIGEYGGRILMVKPEHNWKAVIATLVGSFSQLLVLLSMGLISLLVFSWYFFEIDFYFLPLLLFFGTVGIGLMLFFFFNIDLIIPVARRIPFPDWMKRYLRHLKVLNNYSHHELTKALLFSLARYVTYSFQYFLMLRFFGIDVPPHLAFAGIGTIYLLQTSIPLPPIVGLLARSEIALQIWGFFSDNQIDILGASFTLFTINLSLPALLGAVFIVQTNVMKSLGYEKDS